MPSAALLALALCLPLAAGAQPFSTVDLALGASAAVHAPQLSPRWSPGAGVSVGARVPFYWGEAEGGLVLHTHHAHDPSVPDFTAAFAFTGWGRSLHVGAARLYAGARLGLYAMAFDEDRTVRDRSPSESEMGFGPVAAVGVGVGGGWEAFAEAQHLVVLTAVRLDLIQTTLGVRRRFASPGWLTDVLR
jgi:hypothetical protein